MKKKVKYFFLTPKWLIPISLVTTLLIGIVVYFSLFKNNLPIVTRTVRIEISKSGKTRILETFDIAPSVNIKFVSIGIPKRQSPILSKVTLNYIPRPDIEFEPIQKEVTSYEMTAFSPKIPYANFALIDLGSRISWEINYSWLRSNQTIEEVKSFFYKSYKPVPIVSTKILMKEYFEICYDDTSLHFTTLKYPSETSRLVKYSSNYAKYYEEYILDKNEKPLIVGEPYLIASTKQTPLSPITTRHTISILSHDQLKNSFNFSFLKKTDGLYQIEIAVPQKINPVESDFKIFVDGLQAGIIPLDENSADSIRNGKRISKDFTYLFGKRKLPLDVATNNFLLTFDRNSGRYINANIDYSYNPLTVGEIKKYNELVYQLKYPILYSNDHADSLDRTIVEIPENFKIIDYNYSGNERNSGENKLLFIGINKMENVDKPLEVLFSRRSIGVMEFAQKVIWILFGLLIFMIFTILFLHRESLNNLLTKISAFLLPFILFLLGLYDKEFLYEDIIFTRTYLLIIPLIASIFIGIYYDWRKK